MSETHYYTCDVCDEHFVDETMLLRFVVAPAIDGKMRSQLEPADPGDRPDVHVCMSCARVVRSAHGDDTRKTTVRLTQ